MQEPTTALDSGITQGPLSQLPGCASVALGNNAGEKQKNQMKMVRPERIERPPLRFIGNAALWFRAFHGASQAFYSFVTAGGGANRLGAPISERSISLA